MCVYVCCFILLSISVIICKSVNYSVIIIDAVIYNGPPNRPMEITESERHSCDVPIDDNTRIVLSLDVFHHSDERAIRVSNTDTVLSLVDM